MMLKQNVFYVWSTGLEEWEPAFWNGTNGDRLILSHRKRFGNGHMTVFIDTLGRYFCLYQEKLHAEEA